MTKPPFSDAVRELINKARIMSFATWQTTHPPDAIARFQAADDKGRYLTDDDLQHIQASAPGSSSEVEVVRLLRDQAGDIVDEARGLMLQRFPDITQPGGALFPSDRAEACWRDFWQFLRCITYGIAGQHTDYTSAEGLHYLRLLYQEVHVPLDAMIVGLEAVKTASLNRIESEQRSRVAPYFDHLIDQLKQFG